MTTNWKEKNESVMGWFALGMGAAVFLNILSRLMMVVTTDRQDDGTQLRERKKLGEMGTISVVYFIVIAVCFSALFMGGIAHPATRMVCNLILLGMNIWGHTEIAKFEAPGFERQLAKQKKNQQVVMGVSTALLLIMIIIDLIIMYRMHEDKALFV